MVDQYQYSQSDIIELFKLINQYVFKDPLPESELNTVSTFREIDRKNKDDR
ncbi:MAG: hypothetical protein MJ224_00045 [archaeon]|nr:hypothetical protein [archaeon]